MKDIKSWVRVANRFDKKLRDMSMYTRSMYAEEANLCLLIKEGEGDIIFQLLKSNPNLYNDVSTYFELGLKCYPTSFDVEELLSAFDSDASKEKLIKIIGQGRQNRW